MQKITNLKLNGLKAHGLHINPEKGKDKRGITGTDTKKLIEISEKINSSPEKLNLHKTIIKILNSRKEAVKNGSNIDWSTAEALAFGSLLKKDTQ